MNVLIIGAGWLGLPLAKHLSHHHHVTVSKTSAHCLSNQPFPAIELDLSRPKTLDNIPQDTDAIIGCFPPGFRKGNGEEYAGYWLALCQYAKQRDVKKVVMVSSTTVYPSGAHDYSESDATLELAIKSGKFSDNARIMLTAEQHLIDSGLDYAIVRCSGLFGPNRHPSRFASKLKQVSTQAPANMLHLDDAVGAVSFALTSLNHEVVNATSPITVPKAEFYQHAIDAAKLDTPLPPIVDAADKKILTNKLIELGYQFRHPSSVEALAIDV
ncbi:NAD-dependent epimerase/dehydratase family protein [Vibrio maerlii]|uniref:NAD-dependent epimerase/dehydratase family protein n=1 Tax=Vibrio maerlii TaxID=2231648 RepID=UPI000E3BF11B|nr:NAD-dependent epimerase/dehydratase family protein [Vibrio maerlii]